MDPKRWFILRSRNSRFVKDEKGKLFSVPEMLELVRFNLLTLALMQETPYQEQGLELGLRVHELRRGFSTFVGKVDFHFKRAAASSAEAKRALDEKSEMRNITKRSGFAMVE